MAVPAFRSLNLGVLRIPDMLRDIDNPRQLPCCHGVEFTRILYYCNAP